MKNKRLKHAYGTGGSIIVDQCQVCNSTELERVLFLGYLPPVNTMPVIGQMPKEEPSYPALFLKCTQCQLFQLGLIVDPKILFPPEYPYTSGTTKILRENFAELYRECRKLIPITNNDLVVDIGSNDGTLLSNFAPYHNVYGIEPAEVGNLANKNGISTLITYLNAQSVAKIKKEKGRAKIITATNVFAHIEDIQEVVKNVLELLDNDGVFITESHYLYSLIETLQYDTIYHEHLRYYSLQSLTYLFNKHGLEIFHAKRIPTHGGSIRVYASRMNQYNKLSSVDELLKYEKKRALDTKRLKEFNYRVVSSKLQLLSLLSKIKAKRKTICGIGAPSRASTFINYIGLDEGIIDCVLEIKGSHKIGKYVPGTMIPVVEESYLWRKQPDYAMLFSWHIADELIPKLKNKGFKGIFIVPLPEPRIIT